MLTQKQQEFLLACGHRWNVKIGATGSGKSFVDYAVVIPKRILACRGEGLIVLMGNTLGTLERNILQPMRDIWGSCVGAIRRSDNTVQLFGRRCYALGADNAKHVSRIQGATMEYVYGDEITTWERGVFEMLKSRLRTGHSMFDGTCNPASPSHWFKTFLDSDADIYQQHYVIDDGCLPADVVEQLKREYFGTVYYRRYILGEWALADGLIYPMYEQAIAEPPADEPLDRCLSIDYGTQNAFAALLWELHGDGSWYAVREYYYSGRDTGRQKTDEEYGDDLDRFVSDIDGRLVTIIDPSAASFIELLRRREKYHVRAARNEVADGIRETATAMQTGRIRISPQLTSWAREAAGYVWDDKGSASGEDKPVKVNDHAMDAMRYFIHTKRLTRRL